MQLAIHLPYFVMFTFKLLFFLSQVALFESSKTSHSNLIIKKYKLITDIFKVKLETSKSISFGL